MRPGEVWQELRGSDDVRRGVRVHVAVLVLGLAVLGLAAAFVQVKGISGDNLSREPQVVLDGKLWVGALSNLGPLVWMAGATFAAIGWMTTSDRQEQRMFGVATVLGAALLIDDFFLFHDWVGYHSKLLERGIVVGYLVGMVGLLVLFWRTMGSLSSAGILVTLGLLALSVALDELFNSLDQLFEDGAKFLGICTWTTIWVLRARPWALRASGDAGGTQTLDVVADPYLSPEHVRGSG